MEVLGEEARQAMQVFAGSLAGGATECKKFRNLATFSRPFRFEKKTFTLFFRRSDVRTQFFERHKPHRRNLLAALSVRCGRADQEEKR